MEKQKVSLFFIIININSSDAILPYKKVNFKELSSKYEQMAKQQSKIEQEKIEIRKIAIKEKEKQRNLIKEFKDKLSSCNFIAINISDNFSYRNEYMIKLLKKVNIFENPPLDKDKDKGFEKAEIDKIIEFKFHLERESKEQMEIEKLIKQFKEYYYRDYHYIYNYPYKKPVIKISCFKENEELKDNIIDSEFLEKDYMDVYKNIKLLSTKNLQRYDCWTDISPEEWLEICSKKQGEEESHGRSPNYSDGE